MDSVPPVHGPVRPLDDVLADLGAADDGPDTDDVGPPPDLPEVVEAVTGRARDLHRLADRLSADGAGDSSLSAVALLRAHAGAVGDLAEHLQAAGERETDTDPTGRAPATTGADATGPDDADPAPDGGGASPADPAGVPRSVG